MTANLDKNSETPLDSASIFENYMTYGYKLAICKALCKGYKGHHLTIEDMITIDRILIGCSKYVLSSYTEGAKRRAKAASRPSKRRLALISLFAELIMTSEDTKSQFRPSHIRRTLPDDVNKITPAQLTRMLNISVKFNLVSKAKKDPRKRGSPKKIERPVNEPGPPSFYQSNEYFKKLKELISEPLVRRFIFTSLLESNVIDKWLYSTCLFVLYLLKFSKFDTVRNILRVTNRLMQQIRRDSTWKGKVVTTTS
jgi:hypothetical protein